MIKFINISWKFPDIHANRLKIFENPLIPMGGFVKFRCKSSHGHNGVSRGFTTVYTYQRIMFSLSYQDHLLKELL